ncbi:tail protein X [Campylobacter concisus]|uniref:tail protein X n=1 Tax=Campylobacter concisus TaxID=199 RepID=UPI000D304DF4|nr:tail protein X [Campylobacter concisus]
MTKIYIAKDNDRLDTIVYAHYGYLRFFEQVLALNPKLAATLKAGDRVFLPEIKEKAKEQAKLW